MRNDIRQLRDADVQRKTQHARKINTAKAWRELAKELIRSGYARTAPIVQECYENADICELAELETK